MEETTELEGAAAQQDEPQAEPEQLEAERSEGPAEGTEDQQDQSGQVLASSLKEELDSVRAEADEYLDGWQRARAEFANYRKRVEREQQDARPRIVGETISRYLGIVDDLERALRERPTEGEAAAWAEGIELIYRKLMALLEAEGVEVIPAEGQEFDPMLHEALSHEQSDQHEEGRVIDVIQPGYRMGERVLRPAMVRVAK